MEDTPFAARVVVLRFASATDRPDVTCSLTLRPYLLFVIHFPSFRQRLELFRADIKMSEQDFAATIRLNKARAIRIVKPPTEPVQNYLYLDILHK
jgi:hypothetical protein